MIQAPTTSALKNRDGNQQISDAQTGLAASSSGLIALGAGAAYRAGLGDLGEPYGSGAGPISVAGNRPGVDDAPGLALVSGAPDTVIDQSAF